MIFEEKRNGKTISLNKKVVSYKTDFYGVKRKIALEGISVSVYKKSVVFNIREAEDTPSTVVINNKAMENPYTWKLNSIGLNKKEVGEMIEFLKKAYDEMED